LLREVVDRNCVIPAALAAARATRGILAGVLFELSPTDPLILFTSTIAILSIAALFSR
jgi:hypothetical protein